MYRKEQKMKKILENQLELNEDQALQILHDLKAPLMALNFSLHSLSRPENLNKFNEDQLRLAQAAHRRLKKIINGFSQDQNEKQTETTESINVEEEIKDCLSILSSQIQKKNITVNLVMPQELIWIKHNKSDFYHLYRKASELL